MLIHPTVERLRDIGLSAMADALVEMQSNPDAAELPHADWLGLLVDREATARDNRRLSRRLHTAKLRQAAVVENVDLRSSRGLDRAVQGARHQLTGFASTSTSPSRGRPARAKVGWPVRTATRPAATVSRSSTSAHRASSPTSLRPAARGGSVAS